MIVGIAVATIAVPAIAQEHVLRRLEESPRHHEWVSVDSGDRAIDCFVVYPEVAEKATAVLVIHENRGLTDWVRGLADQVAEAGHIAIAPDLLSGAGPDGGNSGDFESQDAARTAIYQLDPDQVTADLNAVADHVPQDPACNGKLAVAGFCWGGGQSSRFATNRSDLKAAFVFYGRFDHTPEDLERITCPVFGFYGGNDARINATIPETEAQMEAAGKRYEPVIYEGAGHGFMRAGDDPDGSEANQRSRSEAWERWEGLLEGI
jgi:carboxymethylenebutenolidase